MSSKRPSSFAVSLALAMLVAVPVAVTGAFAQQPTELAPRPATEEIRGQIGRASCRERV